MSSPNDNIQMKDGADATYKLRTKDVSAGSDGSLQYARNLMTPYPVDYGIGGCFHIGVASNTIAAGLAGGATILSFQNPSSSLLALVRRIKIECFTGAAGFAAGLILLNMYAARSFTVMDTGGTLANFAASNGKLRTSSGTPASGIMVANTGAITPGTRTLSPNAIELFSTNAPTTANTSFASQQKIFEKLGAEHPLVLAQNEGFVINAYVPATGTWTFAATVEWDEVPIVNF